ncbi:MAG: 2-oxoacid:acceptor oxidoreductase family protein [Candidatus Altimarinota bacterium]
MFLNIRVTGPAGLGINSTSDIITNIFAILGYNIITDVEYESRIKGGVNYFDIFVSDAEAYLTKYCDVLLAFNAESLEKTIFSLKKDGVVFCNQKITSQLKEKAKKYIEENNISVISLEINDKYDNTYLLALFSYYFGIETEIIKECLGEIFARKGQATIDANIKIFENAYAGLSFETSKNKIEKIGEKKVVSYGNKMVSAGAVDAELEYYSAYPMTPASTILTEIIASKKVPYLQAEDEIAVINSALGSSFTGARSMVGTSGGGFALMTEALSFAIQAEIGIVVALSQRAGPSTGTPTYHETGDINFALNPTFGDFDHIVLTPSSLEEAYYFSGLSLNLADKYQSVVILLLDKQFSELSGTIGKLEKVKVDRGEILQNPPDDYKRYEFTQSGISPRVVVGTPKGDFIASSYEHDEFGATSEDSENKKLMTEKRWKKLQDFFQKEGISGFEVLNPEAKKMLIVFSATLQTAKEFIKNNPEYGIVVIKFLKPLDERLYEVLREKQEIIFIENNYSGQLENYISNQFGLKYIPGLKISHLRKYDLFPFYIEDFNTLISK